ncbi:hypothetical protein MD484_g1034, partial [Candolleomyces efflorescens]
MGFIFVWDCGLQVLWMSGGKNALRDLAQAASDWATGVLKTYLQWEKSWYEERGVQGLKKMGYEPRVIQEAIQSTFNDTSYASRSQFRLGTSRKVFRYHFNILASNAETIYIDQFYKQRRAACRSLVTEYQIREVHPSKWTHVPRQLLFHCNGGILPHNFDPTLPDSTTVLTSRLTAWYGELHAGLVDNARSAQPSFVGDGDGADVALDLAAIVFSCANCLKGTHHIGAALVGWDNILAHICSSDANPAKWHGTLHWSNQGHASALALMELVGKDPLTTTAKDMDKLDARFYCGNCECKGSIEARRVKVLTWRECLTHVLYRVKPGHHNVPQTWFLLSEEATQAVKLREGPYPLRSKPIWGCGRCAKHLETPDEYGAVVAHITEEHNVDVSDIAELEIGHDLVYFPNIFARLRWDHTRDLIGHIKQYHVPNPIEGRDYMEVAIISGEVKVSR